jgi:hypothetical protein
MNHFPFLLLVLTTLIPTGCSPAPMSTSQGYVSGKLADVQMPKTFDELYTDFVMASFDKQLRLADLHAGQPWEFDMDRGEILFNDAVAYKVQILGTESEESGTWMWAWANTASQIPDSLLRAANDLRSFGAEHGVAELTDDEVALDRVDGHTIALIGLGLCNAQAYYRCPYDGGAMFVLITDDTLPLESGNRLERLSSTITQAISNLDIADHKAATIAYCRRQGLQFEERDDALTVTDGRSTLTIEFDDLKRIARISGAVKSPDGN